jgi:succinoglycan biosynthesis protein ExoM
VSDLVVTVDVCLCTYKRGALLNQCINSLLSQEGVAGIHYRIIIVDNDEFMSAEHIVDTVKKSTDVEIIYVSEKRKNISHARNLCLTNASAEYICFIDDDEVASSLWLKNLYNTIITYDTDIAVGPVIATYPSNTPKWVIKSGIFERVVKNTGDSVTDFGTGNCMVRRSTLIANKSCFDESYGLSGGEDSKFFYELFSAGSNAAYCREAEVYEEAAKARMSVFYFMKRSLRGGQTFITIRLNELSRAQKVKVILIKLLHISFAFLMTLLTLPLGKHVYVKWMMKTASSVGQIQGLFNKKIDLY